MNEYGVTIFTRRWTRTVCDHAVVLHSEAETYGVLEKLVRRLVDALVAEPFTPDPGYQIGVDLVAAQIATPQVLGSTSMLIGQRLLHDLQLQDRNAPSRLAGLLGAMVTGFTTGLRDRTFAEQQALVDAVLAIGGRDGAVPRDRITGTPKWELLIRRLADATAAPGPQARLGLCLINLDRFKEINANLGQNGGDQVLRVVADRLRRLAAESGHFLAYRGADEFAFVVDGTTGPDDVTGLAARAIETVEDASPVLNGRRVRTSASAGVVESPAADADPAGLIGAAELALAWAKAERRGRWVVFDPERGAAAAERFALAAAMPDALARGEFTVYYQPLVRLATEDLAGVEALVRWRHPTRGLLAPGQFIDLAERTGLIVPLGAKVLQRACVQAARWRAGNNRPPFVSVNVAAAQLHRPGLPEAVTEVLDTTGLPAGLLQLEITENALLDPASVDRLEELTRMGVRIALDDFGTGYCRLGDLSNLPVHTIKTAACFVEFLRAQHTTSQADETVLTAIIDLSHQLGLTVTAEGIETPAQARRLAELGCDTGQGFHLGQPMPAEEIAHLLRLWGPASLVRSSRRRRYQETPSASPAS